MTKPSKKEATSRLRRCLDEIPELKNVERFSARFEKWQRDTKIAITNTFIDDPQHIKDFEQIGYISLSFPSDRQRDYAKGLDNAAAILESMIDEIKEYWADDDQTHEKPPTKTGKRLDTNEVFIVHGRDESTKQTVARFLEKLSLTPTILHEQPNSGRTLIEKFEQHAPAAFAVILLTPDDVGAVVGEEDNLKPRARQNVILELGYFLGLLGRDRVCPLIVEGVEIPSDYDGVAYVRLDEFEGWQLKLIRELRAAGLDIDANLA